MPNHATIPLLALACLVAPVRAQSPAPAEATKATTKAAPKPKEEAAPKPEDVVLVSADGFTLTAADVQRELSHQPGRVRFLRDNPEGLRDVVEKMLRRELLGQEAERRHYDDNAAVVQAVKEEAVQQLHQQAIDEKITPSSISADEVKAFYDEHAAQFHRPAMRRARHILVEKRTAAQALLKQARQADDRAFSRLAREHSIDTETKQRGGDLRFFTLEEEPKRREAPVHPAIRKAAFALKKPGDTVKQPVEVDGRFSIVRLTGARDARHTTLEQADASIRTRLWRQARRDALKKMIKGLEAKYAPKVFAERVEDIELGQVDMRPGGFAPDPAPARKPHGGDKHENSKPKE